MPTQLQALRDQGQSPWVDFITRKFLNDGEFGALIGAGVVGVTSNPTIFQKAISEDSEYDAQLQQLAQRDLKPYDAFIELAREDIRSACDQLGSVHSKPRKGIRDGWVSLEVDPRLAHDAAHTLVEGKRLHELIDRPNLMVKIPGTEEGLTAIEDATAAGIPVNVTLLFSLERHRQAAEAYIRGLRRLRDAGGDLASVASVASSSSRASTPRPIAASTSSAGTTSSRARSRSPTQSWPIRRTSPSSPVKRGMSSPPRARRRSAACGRRRPPRTPPTATCSTSRS